MTPISLDGRLAAPLGHERHCVGSAAPREAQERVGLLGARHDAGRPPGAEVHRLLLVELRVLKGGETSLRRHLVVGNRPALSLEVLQCVWSMSASFGRTMGPSAQRVSRQFEMTYCNSPQLGQKASIRSSIVL